MREDGIGVRGHDDWFAHTAFAGAENALRVKAGAGLLGAFATNYGGSDGNQVQADAGTDVFTCLSPHNLAVGDPVAFANTRDGVTAGQTYWVLTTPSPTQFKVTSDHVNPVDLTGANTNDLLCGLEIYDGDPTAAGELVMTTGLLVGGQTPTILDRAGPIYCPNGIWIRVYSPSGSIAGNILWR
jgi:hypothetical protein